MDFDSLYDQMEQKLQKSSGRSGFQTEVLYTHPTHPKIKDSYELNKKREQLREQTLTRLVLLSLSRTASNPVDTISLLKKVIADVLIENQESLNDHHAAKAVFDEFEEIIKDCFSKR